MSVIGLVIEIVPPEPGGVLRSNTYEVRDLLSPAEGVDGGMLMTLQGAVDGLIEPIPTNPNVDITMWCNDEGKGLSLPRNEAAMMVWELFDSYRCLANGDYLVGNIAITGGNSKSGETKPLGEKVREEILSLCVFLSMQDSDVVVAAS